MRELSRYYQKLNKQSIRRTITESSSSESCSFDSIIINNFINFLEDLKFKSMAIYSPTRHEIDTLEIFYYLKKRKIEIFYPLVSSNLLEFGLVEDLDDLKIGEFGVGEPHKGAKKANIDYIDLFLIPCLAIDENNKRLGYGGGFYDKAMKNIDSKKTLAILRPKRLIRDFSAEAHDIKIGKVISVEKQNMEESDELN